MPNNTVIRTRALFIILCTAFALTACYNTGVTTTVPVNNTAPAPTPGTSTYTLSIANSGGGTVTSAPAGINCGSACSYSFASGTSVSLTATANSGYSFTGWSGACTGTGTCTITMSVASSVTAAFALIPTGGNAINLSLIPARTTGVAPLSVFFDASGTTAGAITRPFHDLEYRWTFGDPANDATWATGAQPGVNSKNQATGPVAAHVFESPGTYTVSVSATDGTNATSTTTTITVQDPNVVFSGTNTICVAASTTPVAGSGGCPAGAISAQQASFPAAISSYADTGKRVLFKRGDTFAAATGATITATGPGIVGAYGSGALPLIQMTGNTNVLGFSSSSTPGFKDWRIMDLDMDGMGGSSTVGTGINDTGGGLAQVTVLRVTYRNMNNAIGFALDLINYLNNYFIANGRPAEATHSIDQVTVVDSKVVPGPATVYSAYDSGNRIAFMGNDFDNGGNGGGSHITRWPFLNKAVISNNSFSRPGFTRLAIKLHAPYWNSTFNTFDPTATQPVIASNLSNYSVYANGDGYTKYVVIADNKLTDAPITATSLGNPWSVELGPQDSGSDERIRNVIVERNWWVASTNSQVALRISASEITARNNIFDFSNGSNSQTAIQVVKDGVVLTSDQVRLYNNSVYSSYVVPSGQFVVIDLAAQVTNITARNNLAYAPNAQDPAMFVNGCGACLTQSNNSTDAQVKNTSPNFSTMPPVAPSDFRPATGSYTINGGTGVPVWSDFFRTIRPQHGVVDIGAVEGL